jgi:hypothetical protein
MQPSISIDCVYSIRSTAAGAPVRADWYCTPATKPLSQALFKRMGIGKRAFSTRESRTTSRTVGSAGGTGRGRRLSALAKWTVPNVIADKLPLLRQIDRPRPAAVAREAATRASAWRR